MRICGDHDGKIHLLMDYIDRRGDVTDPCFEITQRDVLKAVKGF